MSIIMSENMKELNRLDNEMDQIYNSYLSAQGISMTTLWILYSAYTCNGTATQREICNNWFCAPQTVNSAMKKLESSGVIELFFVEGNRKSKQIRLTDKGMEECKKLVGPLIRAENDAFAALSEKEQLTLLFLLAKYKNALKEQLI